MFAFKNVYLRASAPPRELTILLCAFVRVLRSLLSVGGSLCLCASATAETRLLRLVSAPDLINADVEYNAPRCFDMDETDPDYAARRQVVLDARAAAGHRLIPGYPEANSGDPVHPHDLNQDGILSIQEGYRGGMQDMLEHIAAEQPDAFLASGDLIDGEWATQPGKAFSSAPLADKQQHIREMADIYYDAYYDNFRNAGYDGPIFGVIGDHEIGDNNWSADKVALVPTFFEVYRDKMVDIPETVVGDGAYVDAPVGREGRWWAKQMENVLLMGIETFDIRYDGLGNIIAVETDALGNKRALIPPDHLAWIESTLQTAAADPTVEHIIVMGHCPFDVPGVRTASSSNLRIGGGTASDLWQLFETYDVTLYLAGEVHAVSGFKQNGVTQLVTAGNQFSSAQSNYLVIDVYSDRIHLTLKEAYKFINGSRSDNADPINDDNSKSSEWRSRHPYRVVGTATLYLGGTAPSFVEETGQLAAFVVDNDNANDPTTIPPLVITPDPELPEPETTLPQFNSIKRIASKGIGTGNFQTHPGLAINLKPARDSVLLVAVASQHGVNIVMDPVVVDQQFEDLVFLGGDNSFKATTAVYGLNLGAVQTSQNVVIGGSLWRSDWSETKDQRNHVYAVQLAGATLAGFDAKSILGTSSPLTLSFSDRNKGTFIFGAASYNQDGIDVQLNALFDEETRSGSYFGGSGFFDHSATGQFSWGAGDSPKGSSFTAVAINAVPALDIASDASTGEIVLSWHSSIGPGAAVQTSTSLSPESWADHSDAPTAAGDMLELRVAEPASGTPQFFRLRY